MGRVVGGESLFIWDYPKYLELTSFSKRRVRKKKRKVKRQDQHFTELLLSDKKTLSHLTHTQYRYCYICFKDEAQVS